MENCRSKNCVPANWTVWWLVSSDLAALFIKNRVETKEIWILLWIPKLSIFLRQPLNDSLTQPPFFEDFSSLLWRVFFHLLCFRLSTPKADEQVPPVPSENVLCSWRSSGASTYACTTSSWRTLGCHVLSIDMPSVVSSLIMTPGCVTQLWSSDLQNSHREVLESWNEAWHSRETARAGEPGGFSGWERTRKERIISGLGRQNSEKRGN